MSNYTVLIVYICKADQIPFAGDDAKTAAVLSLNDLQGMELVFYHNEIISHDLTKIK